MGQSQGGCFDREKDKNRLKSQTQVQAPAPIRREFVKDVALQGFLNDMRKSQPIMTGIIHLYRPPYQAQTSKANHSTNEMTTSVYIRHQMLQPHSSVDYGQQNSYKSHGANKSFSYSKYDTKPEQKSTFTIHCLKFQKIKEFLLNNKKNQVDHFFPNPFNLNEVMILANQQKQNELLIDFDIEEKSFNYSNIPHNRLYMDIKQYLSQKENQLIGYYLKTESTLSAITLVVRKLNAKASYYNNFEMQMLETINETQLEEVVNERIQDNLFGVGLLQLLFEKATLDINLIVFKQKQKPHNYVNIVTFDDLQFTHGLVNQEITKKIEMLCSNNEFDLIGLMPNLRKRQIFIMLQQSVQ